MDNRPAQTNGKPDIRRAGLFFAAFAIFGLVLFFSHLPIMHQLCGLACLQAGDYKGAVGHLSAALQMYPRSGECHVARMTAYRYLNQFRPALDDADAGIILSPKSPDSYINRAVLYCAMNEFQKALADLNQAIELAPNSTHAIFDRGSIEQKLGQSEKAVQDLSQSIAQAPTFAPAYIVRSHALISLNRRSEALSDLHKCEELFERWHNIQGLAEVREQIAKLNQLQ